MRLKKASHVTVLIGNEFSQGSRIPLFRDELITEKNYCPREFETLGSYYESSQIRDEWYTWRNEMKSVARPSLAHYAMVDMAAKVDGFEILDAGSDGLQKEAGFDKSIELYGNIYKDVCTDCKHEVTLHSSSVCPACGTGTLRPNARWFSEPVDSRTKAKASALSAVCEVFMVLGCSQINTDLSVYPYMAKGNGSYLVELSKEKSLISDHCNESIRGNVCEILPKISILINNIM